MSASSKFTDCGHSDFKYFCFSTNILLCEKCYTDNLKKGLEARKVEEIARGYLNLLLEKKNMLERRNMKVSSASKDLSLKLEEITEKLHPLFQKEIQKFSQRIEEKINSLFLSASKEVEELDSCISTQELEKCNRDLTQITAKIEGIQYSEFMKYYFQHFERESNVVNFKQAIQNAERKIKNLEDEIQEHIHWLRRTEHFDSALHSIHKKKIGELKNIDFDTKEFNKKLKSSLATSIELQVQIDELSEIRQSLIQDIETKKKEIAVSEDILFKFQRKISEYQLIVKSHEQNLKDLSTESLRLEDLIRLKKELLRKFDSDLLSQCSGGDNKEKSKLIIDTLEKNSILNAREEREDSQTQLVHFFDEKKHLLILYHIGLKQFKTLKKEEFPLPMHHDSVQIKNKIVFTGGFIPPLTFSTKSYLVEERELNLSTRTLGDMLLPKSHHKLVALNSDIIYSLGGKTISDKKLNNCERYSFSENKWKEAPQLNEKKIYLSATAFHCTTLYAFGGITSGHVRTIEAYTPTKDKRWSVIKLASKSEWGPSSEAASFQLSETEIIIFGGNTDLGSTADVFIFDTTNKQMKKSPYPLLKKEWFTMRSPILYESHIYIVGNLLKDVHFVDIISRKWNIIEEINL